MFLNRFFILSIFIVELFLISSCTFENKKKVDDFKMFEVRKSDFEYSLDLSGVLEVTKSITKGCPVNGYDIRIVYLIETGVFVSKGDTLCKLECADLNTMYNAALGAVDWAKSNLEKTKAQQESEINILSSQIKSNNASYQIAMLDSTKLKFLSPSERRIAELNLEKLTIQKQLLEKRLSFRKIINKSALKALQSKLSREERTLTQTQDKLNRLVILADTNGYVIREKLWGGRQIKNGDIIWGNAKIVNIIDITAFQVRMLVNENQFQSIQINQSVNMSAEATPSVWFKGKILLKKPSGRPISTNSKIKQFEIVASIDSVSPLKQPGVSINCQVVLVQLKDTILVPIISVFDYDSLKVVYVRKDDKFEKRIVETGKMSDKYVVINKGLNIKERISLSVPPDYLLCETIKGIKIESRKDTIPANHKKDTL